MPLRKPRPPIPGEEHLTRRTGSSAWVIDITIGGKRVRKTAGTTDKAAAARAALLAHAALHEEMVLGVVPERHMTVAEAFDRFDREKGQQTGYGRTAQFRHLATLRPLLGAGTRLADIDTAMVNDAAQQLRARPVAGPTINRYLASLAAVLDRAGGVWGVPCGRWDRSLTREAESKGREVFLEVAQARALVAAVVPHARPILLLALATGLRRANVHGLLWSEVSLDLSEIRTTVKGDKPHAVPLPDGIVDMLIRLQPDPEARTGHVFTFGNPFIGCRCPTCRQPARRGEPIEDTRRAFATAARTAGLTDMPAGRLRFHDLRHSLASYLLAQTGDLQLVRDQLGHASIRTTQRYAHVLPGRREAAIAGATAGLLTNEGNTP